MILDLESLEVLLLYLQTRLVVWEQVLGGQRLPVASLLPTLLSRSLTSAGRASLSLFLGSESLR